MKWDAVFFDFDGVILDSVNVKTKAFAAMFQSYGPEIENAVVRYHLENGGVDRYEKFKYFYENFLDKHLTQNEMEKLSKQFSQLVVKKVIDSPFVTGALNALKELKMNNIPSFIVSGTPDIEIKAIIKEKDLADFFQEIHGSPRKKWEIVSTILQTNSFNPDKCIFIGDALSDYEASTYNNIHFLGIVSENEKSIFPEGTKISKSVTIHF
jgi:HAD superfamily hydrolase (TIGR01549 family)